MTRREFYTLRDLKTAPQRQAKDPEHRAMLRERGEHCQEWHWCNLEADHIGLGLDCKPAVQS